MQHSFNFESNPLQQASKGGRPKPPPDDDEPPEGDSNVSLLEATRERYLNYALSVITSRALPDVRDGFKPVQRRILYAMYANLRLLHTARFRKSAAVVGEVMARFHPHGDQSIYDAMVRQAQPFALRYPLVEGHGNFGSLDGDPPAAMRYTEARLRALASEMLEEIDRNTVAFRDNYDGTTKEPIVLPSRVPQLLVNGCTGIAVGMATNIPPHNLREVCSAAVALIDEPKSDVAALMRHIDGPDFPMGGEILNSPEELGQLYETGRGTVKTRATYHIEKANRRRYIVITSIPFGQNKANVVEQIGDLIRDNKVPQLTDVRDESTDDIRIVCELKRGAVDTVAMAYLYKHTNLQTNFHVNMTVLLPTANPEVGTPAQVGLVTVLRHFLDFRFEVVKRRFEYDLARLERRIHILKGFAILFDALDEAIALIRASDGRKDAAKRLMKRFPLDEEQTDAILDLKLYRLAKLEVEAVLEELARLEAEAKRIRGILRSGKKLWGVVRDELMEVSHTHGDERRTLVGSASADDFVFDAEKYIVKEDTWLIFTRDGWVKRQRGFSDVSTIRVREGDAVMCAFRASTRSTVAFFSDLGKAYVLGLDKVSQTSGYGEPVQRYFKLADGEKIVSVVSMDERNLPEYKLRIAVEDEGDAVEDSGEHQVTEAGASEDDTETLRSTASQGPEPDPSTEDTQQASAEDAQDWEEVGPLAVALTRAGKGLIFPLSNHEESSTRSGRKYCSLRKVKGIVDGVVRVVPLTGPDFKLSLATYQGRVLIFPVEQLKLLRSTGMGVNTIRLGSGDYVIDFELNAKRSRGLEIETSRGRQVRISERRYSVTRRGGKGVEVIKRGTLAALEREAWIMDPRSGQEEEELIDEDDEDLLEDELEGEGGDDS
ncbi:MAG: DNA topoisomerase [Rickettsiales bacterium]|nr:DNA topoisomerase [Rickettsiales bacterium]|tara:strand:+ start:2294 stop:4951 length:2658 start_codon:yes stop_codon:yes gene_type:complete